MQKIPLMRASSGMILARDVYRNESDSPIGMPVCGKGTELTATLIERLNHLDVKAVYVEGHPVWTEGEKTLDEMLNDLDKRFAKVLNDPLTSKLYNIYVKHVKSAMGVNGGRQAE